MAVGSVVSPGGALGGEDEVVPEVVAEAVVAVAASGSVVGRPWSEAGPWVGSGAVGS